MWANVYVSCCLVRIQPHPSRQTDTDRHTHTHTVIIVLAARWDNEEFSLAGVQVFSVQGRRERGRKKKKKAHKRHSA